tara:strand:- start:961 stop:1512 length:552 start_codon:yes stop_codon:yes gene_type:complete
MPEKFGAIKRVGIVRDFDEFKRNLNIYVISSDSSDKLIAANQTLKNNLKNWLVQYKIINDTIDILDAVIVNFGIEYTVAIDLNSNRYDVISKANTALKNFLSKNQYDIGEGIQLTDFYKVLQKVRGVIDVINLEIVERTGNVYSNANFSMLANLSADGRRILASDNTVFELKFPSLDIKGSIR